MPPVSRWAWAWQSVGFARQTDLNTENGTDGDFHYFAAEVSVPETTRQMFDLKIATGQVGAKYAPVAGAMRGKLSIKFPAFGLKKAYSPATEEPGITTGVLSASHVLTGLALGSDSESSAVTNAATLAKGLGLSLADMTANFGATFANNEIAAVGSTTSATVQAADGAKFKVGQLFACGSSSTDTAQTLAWIKSIAGDVLTFIDAAGNQPSVNDDVWGTAVAYISNDAIVPITIRIIGDNAAFKEAYVGCYPVSWKFTGKAGEPPMIEMTWECCNVVKYGSGGTLQPLTVTPSQPLPLINTGAARFTMGAAGSAMSEYAGIRDFEIDVTNKLATVPSHSKASGISEVIVVDREVKVKWLHPRASDDTITSGKGPWDSAVLDGTRFQAALYGGNLPGTLISVLLPSLYLAEPAKPVEVDGLLHDELNLRAGTYSSDGASTFAGNSVLRIGWA